MKKTISLILALAVVLSVAAVPAFAAKGDVVDGYCIHCGMPCFVTSQVITIDDHYYVGSCFEYLEPHYHSSRSKYYWYVCPTDDCVTNNVLTVKEIVRLDDLCHYGE